MGRIYMLDKGARILLYNGTVLVFESLMGEYSQSHVENDHPRKVHLLANTPVYRTKGGYKIGHYEESRRQLPDY